MNTGWELGQGRRLCGDGGDGLILGPVVDIHAALFMCSERFFLDAVYDLTKKVSSSLKNVAVGITHRLIRI